MRSCIIPEVDDDFMSLLPGWLKLLRLHKYQDLILSLCKNYSQLSQLTEVQLEREGVTAGIVLTFPPLYFANQSETFFILAGARKKILTNIQKVSDPTRTLADINSKMSGRVDQSRPFQSPDQSRPET